MHRTAPFLFLAALIAILALPAQAQQYPITTDDLEISDATVQPGAEITISGDGFASGAEVVITVGSGSIELARVDADVTGAFSVTLTLPESLPVGTHVVQASGPAATGGFLVLEAVLQVGGSLPFTGTRINPLVVGIVALVTAAAGTATLRYARR